jgi:hypothetical protein
MVLAHSSGSVKEHIIKFLSKEDVTGYEIHHASSAVLGILAFCLNSLYL